MRPLTSAPYRALALSRHEVEGCGDVVLHYKACRRALRHARKLAMEAHKLQPPPIINYLLTRLVEELRCYTEADRQRAEASQESNKQTALPPPPAPAKPQAIPPGLEWIDLALALLLRHKGDITAKEVALRVGVSEPTLCKNEDWQKARETYRQSRKKSEEKSDAPSEAESDEE
jgi:hypothetical protein